IRMGDKDFVAMRGEECVNVQTKTNNRCITKFIFFVIESADNLPLESRPLKLLVCDRIDVRLRLVNLKNRLLDLRRHRCWNAFGYKDHDNTVAKTFFLLTDLNNG